MSYNGHKNYNHWNVALWINNDEGLHNLARECVSVAKNRAAAVNDFLALVGSTKTPDGAPYSKSAVRAAMTGM